MDVPDIRYARSGDVSIAYQVLGDGPLDLVVVRGSLAHLDSVWEQPLFVRHVEKLASFSRVLLFDKRGMGLSDRLRSVPTLEARMDDVRAVMDAAEVECAALLAAHEGTRDRCPGVATDRPLGRRAGRFCARARGATRRAAPARRVPGQADAAVHARQ